ncbi:MAG: trypsin-like peptidase domain-containing protein [Gammaproteobacteria bacterium]|nr:trypsin-like peptidase domain-containing protein [Gammaproteobacteria bacterium]
MTYWIKYILAGVAVAFFYLLLWSESGASVSLRQWISHRLFVPTPQQPVENQTNIAALQTNSYATAISRSAPAVVFIQTVGKGTLQKNPNPTSIEDQYLVNVGLSVGSGVIVDSRGYVVTNYHVIRDAKSIKVQLSDGRQKIATVIGSDPFTDLALLFIDLDNLPTPIVNIDREVRTGDVVFAVGNPYGQFDQTVTMGIVSATRSTQLDLPFYQIDAAIHPGNSGGALINAYGEIIGITAQQLAAQGQSAAQTGIGFSIPYPVVQYIVEDLMDDGKINRGWAGFTGSRLNERGHEVYAPDNIENGIGFLVTEVEPNGPADIAGLQKGDFVSKINGKTIHSFNFVVQLMSRTRPGDSVNFEIYREKQPLKVTVVFGESPQ